MGPTSPSHLPPTAWAGGAGMLSAALKGKLENEHPQVSALWGAQGCLFAAGGDGMSWTAVLGWATLGWEMELMTLLGTSSVAPGWCFLTFCMLRSLLCACSSVLFHGTHVSKQR